MTVPGVLHFEGNVGKATPPTHDPDGIALSLDACSWSVAYLTFAKEP